MPLGASYATVAELEARLNQTDDDGTFADLLDAASRDIEQFAHRQFNQQVGATARLYRPLAADLAIVDDFWTVAGLVVETDDDDDGVFEKTWPSTDFEVAPVNGVVSGAGGWPFWQIRPVEGWFRCTRRTTLRLTAQWGWSAVPDGIREATLAVAAQLRESGDGGTVRSEAIDGYSVAFQATRIGTESLGPYAKAGPYRRHEGFA